MTLQFNFHGSSSSPSTSSMNLLLSTLCLRSSKMSTKPSSPHTHMPTHTDPRPFAAPESLELGSLRRCVLAAQLPRLQTCLAVPSDRQPLQLRAATRWPCPLDPAPAWPSARGPVEAAWRQPCGDRQRTDPISLGAERRQGAVSHVSVVWYQDVCVWREAVNLHWIGSRDVVDDAKP